MTSRKIFLIVSALLAVSLLLAACGTSETPTAAPEQPTEAAMEEPTEAAAEEPTEEVVAEPTEEEGPAPAADDKWCRYHLLPRRLPWRSIRHRRLQRRCRC